MNRLNLEVVERDGRLTPLVAGIEQVLVAGYTGRDRASVLAHIDELEKLGVAPPPRVPMVYVLDSGSLTTAPTIQVWSSKTSGEIEFCLIPTDGGTFVAVGSDHTDREQETVDVEGSKRLCPHPISRQVWRYEDVRDRWDELTIRSWNTDDSGRHLYQEGTLESFLSVESLLEEVRAAGHANLSGRLIFGGTVPTLSGFIYGSRFEAELRDPGLGRALECAYDVTLDG